MPHRGARRGHRRLLVLRTSASSPARNGNRELKSETSTSWGAGVVWSAGRQLSWCRSTTSTSSSKTRSLNLRIDNLLQDEADCRIGETNNGTPVDINSPTCQDAIARVERYPDDATVAPGEIAPVHVNPINIANESTDGVDFAFR